MCGRDRGPVTHGLVARPEDWPFSSVHREGGMCRGWIWGCRVGSPQAAVRVAVEWNPILRGVRFRS
jgi:hypothetical protein